jgi:hypothetical protein
VPKRSTEWPPIIATIIGTGFLKPSLYLGGITIKRMPANATNTS